MTDQITSPQKKPSFPPPLPDTWQQMSGDEKFDYYTSNWAAPQGVTFDSDEIAAAYGRRARRWLDTLALQETDRVPECLLIGEYALSHAGSLPATRFYDTDKAAAAVARFYEDFPYSYLALGMPSSGAALDLLGYNLVRWPGSRHVPFADDLQFQYVEKEHMLDAEYDELIANPDGYVLRKYAPRICEGLQGLSKLPSFYNLGELGGVIPTLLSMAAGPLRQAIETLLKAADQALVDMKPMIQAGGNIRARFGTPSLFGGVTKAPYDIIGDTMRGTRGIMMDMYRRPEKLIAACEALIQTSVNTAVGAAMHSRNPFIWLYLHKGADGFMSSDQFATFYWPSFKKQLLMMIDQGLVPVLFAEGGFNQRLDIIAESGLPAGRMIWLFDKTDMVQAKEKFSSFACIGGNVPGSIFTVGSPEEMDLACKNLITSVGQGGGFFLAPGAAIDQAKPENIQAFLQSVHKYSV